jgi:phosphohistidine phosphatase SixA
MFKPSFVVVLAVLSLLAASGRDAADASEAVWALLKQPGHSVLLRHANAPGIGEDPPGIDLKNCALQRNLDDAGRKQARAIGDAFRRHGIKQARLVSSQFCRALETARLLRLGAVEQLAALNYVSFENPKLDAIVASTVRVLKGSSRLTIAVTHISNVKAVTSVTPASAEMVVVRFDSAGKLSVAGRIPAP